MGQIELEHPELFALEFGKFAESDFVSSPEHEMLRVSYCNHSPSGIRPASVHISLFTLASTNINQSAPNLVHMYMTIRSRISSIMELIRSELFELSALELENLPCLTLFTL